MQRLFLSLLLGLYALPAWAGDPCPVSITVKDVGAPDWLSRDEILSELESKYGWMGFFSQIDGRAMRVTRVVEDSNMDRADVRAHDLILSIDGRPTVKHGQDAMPNFSALPIGSTVTMEIQRDEEVIPISVTVGHADPVARRLASVFYGSCERGRTEHPGYAERKMVLNNVINESNGFRCDDAHVALGQVLGDDYYGNDVYLIRGSRRILITMPKWGSICAISAEYDGQNLTDDRARELLFRVIRDYVDDRHENP